MTDDAYQRLMCLGCGFLYDEALGLPEHGISPGTRWSAIPDDWICPDCGTRKTQFEMVRMPYPADAAGTEQLAR